MKLFRGDVCWGHFYLSDELSVRFPWHDFWQLGIASTCASECELFSWWCRYKFLTAIAMWEKLVNLSWWPDKMVLDKIAQTKW